MSKQPKPHPIKSLAGATCILQSVYDREEKSYWQPVWKDKVISKIECVRDMPLKLHFLSGGFVVHQVALESPHYNEEQQIITLKTTTKVGYSKFNKKKGVLQMNNKIHKYLIAIIYTLSIICTAVIFYLMYIDMVPAYLPIGIPIAFIIGVIMGDLIHDVYVSKRKVPNMKVCDLLSLKDFKGPIRLVIDDVVSVEILNTKHLSESLTPYLNLDISAIYNEGEFLVLKCITKEVVISNPTQESSQSVN